MGGLYGQLHVPALPQLATVASYVERWLGELAELGRDAPIPRRYVEQALSIGPDLIADDGTRPVIVHGDLHYANVLARRAGGVAGDRPEADERGPALRAGADAVEPDGGARAARRRRFGARRPASPLPRRSSTRAGLDEARARDWVVVRMVLNAGLDRPGRPAGRSRLTADEQDWVTRCIAITKAVQD